MNKEIGGVSIVAGTAIGASMLALPFVSGVAGFWYAIISLFVCYGYSVATLFLFLEVTLYCQDHDANIISMAHMHLGKIGEIITWFCFLFLLYVISTSYISGGGQLLINIMDKLGMPIGKLVSTIVFTAIFGLVAFRGVEILDGFNRLLLIIMFISYMGLIFMIAPYTEISQLSGGNPSFIPASLAITVASFACHFVVPSLRKNFSHETTTLKRMLFIGVSVPLVIYIIYEYLIVAVLPYSGANGLLAIASGPDPLLNLQDTLSKDGASYVPMFMNAFANSAILTSFIGIVLALSDFLEDGLNLKNNPNKTVITACMTLLPPLLMANLIGGSAFTTALEYSGLFVAFLFGILPVIMAWRARYVEKMIPTYKLPGGKPLLGILFLASTWIMFNVIANTLNWLPNPAI